MLFPKSLLTVAIEAFLEKATRTCQCSYPVVSPISRWPLIQATPFGNEIDQEGVEFESSNGMVHIQKMPCLLAPREARTSTLGALTKGLELEEVGESWLSSEEEDWLEKEEELDIAFRMIINDHFSPAYIGLGGTSWVTR